MMKAGDILLQAILEGISEIDSSISRIEYELNFGKDKSMMVGEVKEVLEDSVNVKKYHKAVLKQWVKNYKEKNC